MLYARAVVTTIVGMRPGHMTWGTWSSKGDAACMQPVKGGPRHMRAAYILVLACHPFCSALKNLYDLWGLSLLNAVNPWLQLPFPDALHYREPCF